jgi:hypothetical protein
VKGSTAKTMADSILYRSSERIQLPPGQAGAYNGEQKQ